LRGAALAFGVVAGLVASLILALGGLDVTPELAAADERQAQAVRFFLLLIANLGTFGAALVLATPLVGGILLVAGAVAWVVAALLLHHTTDLVLVTPPALLLVAAAFALVAHLRRHTAEAEFEIIAPLRAERRSRMAAEIDDEPEIAPAFVAEPQVRPAAFSQPAFPVEEEWDPRRRRPPPPRARVPFRAIEEEDDEDDFEPSGFSRFALGFSGILNFALYAALAGAVLFAGWTLRGAGETPPALAVADASPPPAQTAPASSTPQALAPLLTSAEPAAPSLAEAPSPEPAAADDDFGVVVMSDDPLAPPRLSMVDTRPEPAPAAQPEPEPAAIAPTPEAPPPEPSAAAPGRPVPYPMTPQMAVLRALPGPGPVNAPPVLSTPTDLTGL